MFFKKRSEKKAAVQTDDVTEPRSNVPDGSDAATVKTSSSKSSSGTPKKKKSGTASALVMLADSQKELNETKEQLNVERTAKKKLYSSLVKLANELKRERRKNEDRAGQETSNWYEGGMWRAPRVLPGLGINEGKEESTLQRQPIGLSDLFFTLVTVTAFTRVGMVVADRNTLDGTSLAYFAIFWFIWSKETSYTTRFETSDVSAQVVTLLTCFAVLFGSLSTMGSMKSEDGTRIMMVAAFVAVLHLWLHVRVFFWYRDSLRGTVEAHVRNFAVFTICLTFLEAVTWCVGIWILPMDSDYRWIIFVVGILLSFRVPRSFLANDFHAASSRSGIIFILLLGYLLQSIVLVASPFFEYETPTWEQYSFLGSSCFLLFCIKLLYVDDFTTSSKDHALLVNRTAGFFFNVGQFFLLLSTTVLGSGLNLLTHSYLAATAALPDNAKNLVCAGFSAVIASIFFIKSMHLRRVPVEPRPRALFIGAYVLQAIVMLTVVGMTAIMCFTSSETNFWAVIMGNETAMMYSLCAFALFLLIMSWLDNAVELTLYDSGDDSRQYMVQPFGFWWCLSAEVDDQEVANAAFMSDRRLSSMSPLLGSSVANMKISSMDLKYDSIDEEMAPLKI